MQAVPYLSEHYSNQVQDSPVTLILNGIDFFLWTHIIPQTLGFSLWRTLPLLPFMGGCFASLFGGLPLRFHASFFLIPPL